jgi:phosphate transport system permease protein
MGLAVFGYAIFLILLMSMIAYFVGRASAAPFARAGGSHSRPVYHGAFAAVWVGVPAFILVLAWVGLQGVAIDRLLIATLPASLTEGVSDSQISLYLAEIKNVAAGMIFAEPPPAIREAAETYHRWHELSRWAMLAADRDRHQ